MTDYPKWETKVSPGTGGRFSGKKYKRLLERMREPPPPPLLGCPLCGLIHTPRVLAEHVRIYNEMGKRR